jgi:hypothetical protein
MRTLCARRAYAGIRALDRSASNGAVSRPVTSSRLRSLLMPAFVAVDVTIHDPAAFDRCTAKG